MIKVVNLRSYVAARGETVIRVDRSTPLGNPFPLNLYTRQESIAKYRRWLWSKIQYQDTQVIDALNKIVRCALLKDTVILGCWCKPKACHGDVVKACVDWWLTMLNQGKGGKS